MQTNISSEFSKNPAIKEAEDILRACVHCGFCTATCPTYQILGDELDSPRGRIYLIKQLLEGNEVTQKTQTHLDRCLTCRSCETTCPSGVRYGRLVEIGREVIEQKVPRSFVENAKRTMLRKIVPYPGRFSAVVKIGQMIRPFLPSELKTKVPELPKNNRKKNSTSLTNANRKRKMLVLEGCAQSVVTPETNSAANRVLEKLGIELQSAPKAGCCGAVSHHLSAHEEGLSFMRRNIDAWWPFIERGCEAIITTASGCGAVVKEYGELLKHDPAYAEKAEKVSVLARDVSEILSKEELPEIDPITIDKKIAFHSPCTLQHGQKIVGSVESILTRVGYTLTQVKDTHLCCGSAGTYSVLQPELSQQLLDNKLSCLQEEKPDYIATANIGCQMHMSTKSGVPVKHWIELLDDVL